MNNVLLINESLVFLNVVVGCLLAVWVLLANRKEKLNQVFFIMTILLVLWVIFAFLGSFTKEPQKALIWYRLNWGIVALFFIAAYFFSIYFPKKITENRLLTKFVIILCSLLFLISVFSNLIIEGVAEQEWGMEIIFGKGKLLYYIPIFFLTFLILYNLFKEYFTLTKQERLKVQYVLIGILIFALANLIFNVGFTVLRGSVKFQQLGDYSVIFPLIFTAYAIVKKELFGIKVVLTALLVGLIAILIFVDTFFLTNKFGFQIIKGTLLVLFLFFGYSLIKSTLKEIKLREDLEKAYQELKKLDVAKSEFISMASHQLRTPLTAIKGYISMIIEETYGEIPEKVKEKLQNVFISNERLIKIVNTLLDISKIELGKLELKKEPIQIEDIVQSCYEELKIIAQEKGLTFIFEKPQPPLPKVNVDPIKIRQVFLNLIDNAIKYTFKGEVRINLLKKGASILFSVKDSGAGLTKKEEEEIFQSFTRGSAGLNYFIEGAGLGLSIAKKIVELHKGKIWVESEGENKGSTFFVEIPIESNKT